MANEVKHITEDDVTRLKYHQELEKVSDLMIEKCEIRAGAGYRIVDNPANESNFVPSSISYNENNIANYRYSAPKEEVDKLDDDGRWKYATRLGVSMYTTFEKANKEANRYARKIEKAAGVEEAENYKKNHAWIAKVDYDKEAGIATRAHSQTGHYNLFPFEDTELLELIDESFGYKEVIYDNNKK